MRDKYGDDFYLKDRPRKHRYIYIVGSKTQNKKLSREILYKKEHYPALVQPAKNSLQPKLTRV